MSNYFAVWLNKKWQSNQKSKEEIKFLQGPQSRWEEFAFTVKTVMEFIRGFRALHFIGPCVTFFGSARFDEQHEYYDLTRRVAVEVAQLGFTVLTRGGAGLMEAANRGAKDMSRNQLDATSSFRKNRSRILTWISG